MPRSVGSHPCCYHYSALLSSICQYLVVSMPTLSRGILVVTIRLECGIMVANYVAQGLQILPLPPRPDPGPLELQEHVETVGK